MSAKVSPSPDVPEAEEPVDTTQEFPAELAETQVNAVGRSRSSKASGSNKHIAWDSIPEESQKDGVPSEAPFSPTLSVTSSRKSQRPSVAETMGFESPEELQKKVKAQQVKLEKKPERDVKDLYYKHGVAQRIAKDPIFENLTLAVISLNAVYIAIDTDWNRADALADYDIPFFLAEQVFCVYFTGEIIIRFAAFAKKLDCFKDGWFVFDSLLVTLMVTETWVLFFVLKYTGGESPLGNTAMLRLLRLLRLSRLVRMLRSLPELLILIKGMVSALKSVFYVMCLLIIILYVFSIGFTQMAVGTPIIGETYFPNVAFGMYSLLIYGTFLDDLSNLMDDLRHDKWWLVFLAGLLILLASMTVMNMLVGVLCEVVDAVAKEEREEILMEQITEKMQGICLKIDENADSLISYKEFEKILVDEDALETMREVGVNCTGFVDFAELYFFQDVEPMSLTFDEFMDMVRDLRDTNYAKVKDVLNLWKNVQDTGVKDVQEMHEQLVSMQVNVTAKLESLDSKVQDLSIFTAKLKKQRIEELS
jgi:voltage-gated sodium channel